jgi:hypothetical protein
MCRQQTFYVNLDKAYINKGKNKMEDGLPLKMGAVFFPNRFIYLLV